MPRLLFTLIACLLAVRSTADADAILDRSVAHDAELLSKAAYRYVKLERSARLLANKCIMRLRDNAFLLRTGWAAIVQRGTST